MSYPSWICVWDEVAQVTVNLAGGATPSYLPHSLEDCDQERALSWALNTEAISSLTMQGPARLTLQRGPCSCPGGWSVMSPPTYNLEPEAMLEERPQNFFTRQCGRKLWGPKWLFVHSLSVHFVNCTMNSRRGCLDQMPRERERRQPAEAVSSKHLSQQLTSRKLCS